MRPSQKSYPTWGSEAAYPSTRLPLAQAIGANSMPPGSPPLAAVCRGVGPLLYAGVPACGLIATPTNRDRRRRREPVAGGIVAGGAVRARQRENCEFKCSVDKRLEEKCRSGGPIESLAICEPPAYP